MIVMSLCCIGQTRLCQRSGLHQNISSRQGLQNQPRYAAVRTVSRMYMLLRSVHSLPQLSSYADGKKEAVDVEHGTAALVWHLNVSNWQLLELLQHYFTAPTFQESMMHLTVK